MTLPTVECFRQMDIIDQLTALYQAILNISGSEFSPDQISGLSAWYKEDGMVISAGSITEWNDASGHTNHLALLAGDPVEGDPLNGHKTARFNAADALSFNAPILSGTAATIFVLMKKESALSPDSGGWVTDFTFSNHHPLSDLTVKDGSFSSAQKDCGAQVVPIPGNWVIFSARSQSNEYRIGLNGQSQFTTNTNTYSSGDLFVLGAGACDAGFTPDFFLNGNIAEVIIYNAFLTDGQVESVLNYLRNRFAL